MAGENLPKLYLRDAGKTERLLIDPAKLSTGKSHVSIAFVVPSPNSRYIAYGLAAAGSEQTILHILDIATGKDLPGIIDRMESAYVAPNWLPDSTGFVYSRRQKLAPGAPPTEGYKKSTAHLHRLGTDPEQDPVLFSMGTPGVPMLDTDFPALVISPASPYAIGHIKHGDTAELTLYATSVDSLIAGKPSWRKICDVADEVTDFVLHGQEIDLLTSHNAPRYKVVRTSLSSPNFAAAQPVVPESSAVISSITSSSEALYLNLLDAGLNKVARLPFAPNGKLHRIDLPAETPSGFVTHVQAEMPGALISTTSWVRAGNLFAYDPATNQLTDTHLRPQGKFDQPEGYEATEVLVTSHDGVRVPLSIIHKKGIALDGSNPALIIGYGGYGHCMHVAFRPTSLAWLERGGIVAFAHVRGGGELGKPWHQAGRMATKPNTWLDFIACGQYLVDKGYTSPKHLAGEGGSAGGILIGRAITTRPDLFGAAVINVGLSDALRMETTTNGVPNIAEFGSTATPEGFQNLLAMSPFHNVKDHTAYPAVLLTHGMNDPRVEPWMSAKMAARLQAATSSGKPILLRIDYQSGHGIGSTQSQRQELLADTYAFLLAHLKP